ncbi:DUF1573 domain-containing protein [Crateriforma spongiae]|uniref:DUF1573 domain-containing protein n=1 Tax=Crateriforma spongiae TaxID=2724528 RepID=UPI001444AFAD|nr:DUF1573 domain-containing protein [Crateriforma spongiae]
MKLIVSMLVAGLIGGVFAYGHVVSKYGGAEGLFGPMKLDGEVTADNIMRLHVESLPDDLPVATTPQGMEHDFGIMRVGEKGEHYFVIRNEGQSPLTLRQGASTCKCTLGTPESSSLAPGESTRVKLEWTVNARGDDFSQTAEIITNDPHNVAIRLKIQGQIVRDLKMDPDVVALGNVAAGQAVDVKTLIYNYSDSPIRADDVMISGDEMAEFAELSVKEVEPDDPVHEAARQAFEVSIHIEPGLSQGPVNENLWFTFTPVGDDGSVLVDESGDVAEAVRMDWQVVGRVVGALSMIPNPRLSGVTGGGWIYKFGRPKTPDELSGKSFITLKGPMKDSTKLSIGNVEPADIVTATLGDPIGQGEMSLRRLTIELKPGEKPVSRLGTVEEDFGIVTIESDNSKVPPMKIYLTFSLPSARQWQAEQLDAQEQPSAPSIDDASSDDADAESSSEPENSEKDDTNSE